MFSVIRFFAQAFFKAIGLSLTVYFGLGLMLVSTLMLQQRYEIDYRSDFISPLINADSFEEWDIISKRFINESPENSLLHNIQLRITYPGLHASYQQIDDEIRDLKLETLRISKALNAEFKKNPLLKRTWELMVLKSQYANDMEWKDISSSISSFFKQPKQQSKVLSDYSALARRIARLGQNIMKLNYRLQAEAKELIPFNSHTFLNENEVI